jgi:hypothetical protein
MLESLRNDFRSIVKDFHSIDRRDSIIVLGAEACLLLLPLAQNYPYITNILYIGILDAVIAFHHHQKSK